MEAGQPDVQVQELSQHLQNAIWGDPPPVADPPATGAVDPNAAPPAASEPPKADPPKANEEIVDQREWLKREFEVEDVAILKQEREELKKLRESAKTPAEIKYANEQSKLFHEALIAGDEEKIYKFLDQKLKLNRMTGSADINKMSAEEIVKYSYSQKNKNLSSDDVDFIFNKKFSFPAKPVKEITEDDGDYATRLSEWETNVKNIERELVIEAKLAIPDLEKLKTELVLPEIKKQESPAAPQSTKEELELIEKSKQSFLTASEKFLNEFTGLSAQVKDKDVDYTVSYAPSKEEKEMLSSKLKEFADSGLNVNAIFAQRWLNEDRTLNEGQVIKDLMKVFGDEKIQQKMVNDAAAQRLELYLKDKKNINLPNGGQAVNGTFNPDNRTEAQQLQDRFWAATG